MRIPKRSWFITLLVFGAIILFQSVVTLAQPVAFAPATHIPVGDSTTSVAAGDFNRDGKIDLAITDVRTEDVTILLGNGIGGFVSATNVLVGIQPTSIAVGDFNGDGKQDLVVANEGSGTVSILLGNGFGGFAAAMNFPVSIFSNTQPTSVAIGDFNGDGKQDLAVAKRASGDVAILLGKL